MRALIISAKDYFDRYPDGKILSPEGIDIIDKTTYHQPFHHLNHDNGKIDTTIICRKPLTKGFLLWKGFWIFAWRNTQ